MKPPLNTSKKTKTTCAGSKRRIKNKLSLETEVGMPKTSCNIVKPKT